MTKQVLITGGTGLIGRHFIAKYENDYEFTVVSRDPARANRLLGKNVKCLTLKEITDIRPFSIIINLAGEPIADKRWSHAQKTRICESRWNITDALVSLINETESKPDVFISGSAVGIYGRQNQQVITENHSEFHEEFSRTVCKTWEDKAQEAKHVRTCILRTGIVLADDGGALSKMLMPFRMGLGGKISSGTQFMPWIHIDDMIDAIQFLIVNSNSQGAYNITSPNPNTNHFFSLALAKRLDRPMLFTIPKLVLKLAMGESSDLVLFGQKAVPSRLLEEGFEFHYSELKDALCNLDL